MGFTGTRPKGPILFLIRIFFEGHLNLRNLADLKDSDKAISSSSTSDEEPMAKTTKAKRHNVKMFT